MVYCSEICGYILILIVHVCTTLALGIVQHHKLLFRDLSQNNLLRWIESSEAIRKTTMQMLTRIHNPLSKTNRNHQRICVHNDSKECRT